MTKVKKNHSLKSYNTFNIDVNVSRFIECEKEQGLREILSDINEDEQLFILGGGSNVLFTDDFDGTVLFPNIEGKQILRENESEIIIKVYAGENWDEFVEYCTENNFGGIENLSWIPGKVGGACIQNIGAYGAEISEVIDKVEAIDIFTGEKKELTNEECEFEYRDSVFKNGNQTRYILTSATFRLSKNPRLISHYGEIKNRLNNYSEKNIKTIRDIVIDIRKEKLPDPSDISNAGSFFKNPIISENELTNLKWKFPGIPHYNVSEEKYKVPAAWLIEECGWKGKRIGNAGVYKDQALILVNHGNATGKEIYALSQNIKDDVKQKFNIILEEEVQIV